jgi:uncharacterized membrane protein
LDQPGGEVEQMAYRADSVAGIILGKALGKFFQEVTRDALLQEAPLIAEEGGARGNRHNVELDELKEAIVDRLVEALHRHP